jgi:iron complex outermembrane receptor protein
MKNFKHATSRAHQVRTPLRNLLLGGASVLAVAVLVGPTFAQTQDEGTIETVVVTARRAALESAQEIKANSSQIVDAIVADQAGKLPDNSITEVLQRVPGVTINHFAAVGDPDHYTTEGSGVAVRGMTQVNSTLNGREAFSANGGRALLWEDVPPELMASVSVYKSSTADQIEGGIGGSVDLRTHMPFDYDKMTINGSVSANYGDFIDQGRPAASLLFTDRWTTGMGDIGVLVDLAYSDISSRADGIQMEPRWQETTNTNPNGTPNAGGLNVFVPGGFDWRFDIYDRKRVGVYEAVQWQPIENLTIYQTVFESYYNQPQKGVGAWTANGNGQSYIQPGTHYVVGPNGQVEQADSIIYTNGGYPSCIAPSGYCSWAQSDTGESKSNNRTLDITEGFDWHNDALTVSGAFQYVHSTSGRKNYDIQTNFGAPSFGFDMTGGGMPVLNVSGAALMNNASQYIWFASQDHIENHSGAELAANLNAKYDVSNSGFLRAIRFGARYSNRTENDDSSQYNWKELTPGWSTWAGPLKYLSTAQAGDVSVFTFPNFMQGKMNAPMPLVSASFALVGTFDSPAIHQKYGQTADGPISNVSYNPNDMSFGNTKNRTAYLMADFAADSMFGMPMDGNIGVRVVSNANKSNGFASVGTQTLVIGGTPYIVTGGYLATSGGRHYTKVLPSMNIQFMPRDDLHLRFAASQTLTNPSFTSLSASGGFSFVTQTGNVFNPAANPAANGWGGNPNLKPQVSSNVDMSFEWYGSNQTAAHVAFFYKDIKDYLTYGTFGAIENVPLPNGTSPPIIVFTTNNFNAARAAIVRGFEMGGTKFFDFLPDPFDGLGVDANFTYIDSRSPGDLSCQNFNATPPAVNAACFGERITGLPVDGLSRYNYNLTGMYEKGPYSVRLAWTWRSTYLLTPSAHGTQYLPDFATPYGQLDFGTAYKINDNFTIAVDGQNLLGAVQKTVMGAVSPVYGDQRYTRSWFISDRRFSASLKFSY